MIIGPTTTVVPLPVRNIVIIANNKKRIPDIRKLPIQFTDNDLIVRFNKGLYAKDDKTFDNPNNLIVMFREHAVGFSGINADGSIVSKRLKHAKEYYIVVRHKGQHTQTELIEKIEKCNNIKLGILHTDTIEKDYKLGKEASSGFVAMIHFLTNYPNDRVILFGFSWEGWGGHNWKREKQIAKDLESQGRIMIIPS